MVGLDEMIEVEDFDFFNSKGLRNADNTDDYDYNCAGYALDTFSWYSVYEEGRDCDEEAEEIEKLLDIYTIDEIYDLKLQEYTEKMLNDFPNLRVLKDPTEVKENERLIYFRIFISDKYLEDYDEISTDFHFCWFDKETNHWKEKAGSSEIRNCDYNIKNDLWPLAGDDIFYDSRTVYLALKEGK